jgi:hypothetical protein
MTTPVFEARRCTRIGSEEGRGGGPVGRTARRCRACSGVSGFGRGAQQLAGVQVEEQQAGALDADSDLASGEDLCGQHQPAGQGHRAGSSDDALDLDHIPVDRRCQRRRPGRFAALRGQGVEVVDRQVGPHGLDPGTGDHQVDQVAVRPEPHDLPGPPRPEPELLTGHAEVPRRRRC